MSDDNDNSDDLNLENGHYSENSDRYDTRGDSDTGKLALSFFFFFFAKRIDYYANCPANICKIFSVSRIR